MVALLLALLAAVALADAAKYTVWVGYEDLALGLNINRNIPAKIRIHPGDTVIFKQKAHDPHTVTFHPGAPFVDVFTPSFELNMTIATPTVFTDAGYNGSTFATSGMMARGGGFPTEWNATFTTVGKFPYDCAVHGAMQHGQINVVPKNVKIPKPKDVLKQIMTWKKRVDSAKQGMFQVATKSVKPSTANPDGSKTHYIRMGFAKGMFEFLAFFKGTTVAHPGDKLEWYGSFFHTVTFLNGAQVPPLVIPSGGKLVFNPVYYTPTPQKNLTTTGFINSGLLTDPTLTYSLTVGELEGKIEYVCMPHHSSNMIGWINVKPKKTG